MWNPWLCCFLFPEETPGLRGEFDVPEFVSNEMLTFCRATTRGWGQGEDCLTKAPVGLAWLWSRFSSQAPFCLTCAEFGGHRLLSLETPWFSLLSQVVWSTANRRTSASKAQDKLDALDYSRRASWPWKYQVSMTQKFWVDPTGNMYASHRTRVTTKAVSEKHAVLA